MITKNYKRLMTVFNSYTGSTSSGFLVSGLKSIFGTSHSLANYTSITTTSTSSSSIFGNATVGIRENYANFSIVPKTFIKALPQDISQLTENTYTLNHATIVVGNGTTAPTEEDYYLESPITSGLSVTGLTGGSVRDNENKHIGSKIVYTLQNNSSSDITISELGLIQALATTVVSNTPSNPYWFLMDRTVLSTPITIPPGETANISIKFTL